MENLPKNNPKLKKLAKRVVRIGSEVVQAGKDVRELQEYEVRKVVRYGRMLGPGLIAGAADDDAGGIVTYSITGATTGLGLSWLLVLSTPMLIAVQGMCAKIGNVARRGLAAVIKEKYGMNAALFATAVLVLANVATIAADIAGMSVALELLSSTVFPNAIPWQWFVVPMTALLAYVIVYKNFTSIQKGLMALSLFLGAYIISGLLANPDLPATFAKSLVPRISFDSAFIIAAVGLLGTTITPYLFFWQTRTEIEAKRKEGQMEKAKFDIFAGMIYSNLISYFIILSTAAVLFPYYNSASGTFTIGGQTMAATALTAKDIALALKPLAGTYSFYLFAVGLLGASMLAIIVLATSTAYTVCDTFGWQMGLNKKVWQARQFYWIIGGSLALGCILLFAGISPIMAMFWSQVLCGIVDPVLLYFLMKISNDEKIMGKHVNNKWENITGWATFAVISFFVLVLAYQFMAPLLHL